MNRNIPIILFFLLVLLFLFITRSWYKEFIETNLTGYAKEGLKEAQIGDYKVAFNGLNGEIRFNNDEEKEKGMKAALTKMPAGFIDGFVVEGSSSEKAEKGEEGEGPPPTQTPTRTNPARVSASGSTLLMRGKEFFDKKDYDRAEVLFENVLRSDTSNAEAKDYLVRIKRARAEMAAAQKPKRPIRPIETVVPVGPVRPGPSTVGAVRPPINPVPVPGSIRPRNVEPKPVTGPVAIPSIPAPPALPVPPGPAVPPSVLKTPRPAAPPIVKPIRPVGPVTPVAPAPPAPRVAPAAPVKVSPEFNGLLTRSSVYFKPDMSAVAPEYRANLAEIAKGLTANKAKLELTGYAHPGVEQAYMQDLSRRRTIAVRDALVGLGVKADQLKTVLAEVKRLERPTRESFDQMRRVELRVAP